MHEARIRLMSYQKELLKSSNPFTFAVMGRGSGKTYTLSVIALMKLLRGENLILCAQRYDSLRDVLMKDVKLRASEWGLDGVVKFSASDVIERYRLNSSANVRRVKDALRKKEVITFNEKDEPVILDPLFEYWVSNHFFERR